MNNTITEQGHQQHNISNFFRGGIYNSVQDAILETFQPKIPASRKPKNDTKPLTEKQLEKFMRENFS